MKNLINRAIAAEKRLLILLAIAIARMGLTSCEGMFFNSTAPENNN